MTLTLVSIMWLAILWTVVSVWRIPAPRPPLYQLLGVLSCLALVVETYGTITAFQRMNNVVAYNTYFIAEAIAVPAMVYTQRPAWRTWTIATAVFALGVLAWDVHRIGFTSLPLNTALVIYSVVFVAMLMALLWHQANTSKEPLQRMPAFWVFMGLLVYFTGLLPVMGTLPMVYQHDPKLAALLGRAMPILAALRYLLAAHGCRLQARAAKPRP